MRLGRASKGRPIRKCPGVSGDIPSSSFVSSAGISGRELRQASIGRVWLSFLRSLVWFPQLFASSDVYRTLPRSPKQNHDEDRWVG
jgi:hypothetical protein